MDRRLLNAAVSGDATEIVRLALHDPALLLGTTPQGNTCIHIASIHGHEGFCKDVLALSQSLPLLTAVNADGETPLLTAVTRGRPALASLLLRCCKDQQAILIKDKHGCNALHYAIRRGYRALAFELIEAAPDLSKAVNENDESPMFIAAMRNFTHLFDKLLSIPDSADSGACGFNVLHAAVGNGNSGETCAFIT
ncbi:nuclear factor NF-kappa-B p100 subunit-like [Panicum virgatum]|uniref:nuclear factor NF-kappa-B p100 subunit-like n=1 Tax=Panicum virgatum TaxID=38727 RepID=UPI0019D61E87|nr:nuclear factor NF-kappa-B p100 subunit-like [Panicum virgatum]